MDSCSECPSFAVNIDPDHKLCDVCYYRMAVASIEASIQFVPDYKLIKNICDVVLTNPKDSRNK